MNYPSWLDRAEYPFESHFIDVDGGRMHYLDEGAGPPLLFVHGTPTWSFMYRKLIMALRPHFRCIAPDHLGFGLSDKPAGWGYRPEDHARNLHALIEQLDLRDFTLIVHDFGGPIGLSYAIEQPENIAELVLFNTFMWSLRDDAAKRRPAQLFGTALGRLIYTRFNFSPRVLVKVAWGDKTTLTPELHQQYTSVHETPEQRMATWAFARALLGSSDWFSNLWEQRERIADIPALLVWGMRDPTFTARDLARWQALFTDVQTMTLPNVGHFVPDEAGDVAAQTISAFLAGRATESPSVLYSGVE